MPRSPTAPPASAWNTWSSRPAEMVFLPLGVRVTPVVYADGARRATAFEDGAGVRLGRHAVDGSRVELGLDHSGTRLDWDYAKEDPFSVAGSWRTRANGEWGLRFWVNLCLSADGGEVVAYRADEGAALVKVGTRFVALAGADAPVQVTGHESLAGLAAEYEREGYFYLGSRAMKARVIALRFNLEMNAAGRFAAAVADRADLAIARARALVIQGAPPGPRAAHTGRGAGALDAVRDVMAWNTLFDDVNGRVYTAISRHWNQQKFGGYGVWLNDQLYAALMTGLLDPELGRQNLAVALAGATPAGNLACLLTANDAWVDRTQIPIGGFVVWLMFLRARSLPLLGAAYDVLARNHAWWWRSRDPDGCGLCSYGTSDVGEGLYRGTAFGARNESSMDNSPTHDEAAYDPGSRTLTTRDVGLNSLLALDAEMLALIAAELGRDGDAAAHRTRAEATRGSIRDELWDDTRAVFANRLRSGAFVRSLGPTSFYPLVCGAASAPQAHALLRCLADERSFGGRFVIPGTSRDDPAARDNVYWRGRIWPPLNHTVWHGLRRYGFDAEASRLAKSGFDLFRRAWEPGRVCAENYNAETGEALDGPDTDGFYGWGALMPLLAVAEVMDVNPWGGWELANTGEAVELGPIESPLGPMWVRVAGGVLSLARGTQVLFESDLIGRISHIEWTAGRVSLRLPASLAAPGRLRFPGLAPSEVLLARIGERTLAIPEGDAVAFDPGPRDAGAVLTLLRAAPPGWPNRGSGPPNP